MMAGLNKKISPALLQDFMLWGLKLLKSDLFFCHHFTKVDQSIAHSS
jgi:hypothetical protein